MGERYLVCTNLLGLPAAHAASEALRSLIRQQGQRADVDVFQPSESGGAVALTYWYEPASGGRSIDEIRTQLEGAVKDFSVPLAAYEDADEVEPGLRINLLPIG